MLRADLVGANFRYRTAMFFEKLDQFDVSLLEDLLDVGDAITLKVWCVRKDYDGLKISYQPSAFHNRKKYSLWSRPVESDHGVLYRSGYHKSKARSEAAVFQSSDSGASWKFVSTPFADPRRSFSEADIVCVGPHTWFAVCREDGAGDRGMYFAYSYDGMQSWTKPKKFDVNHINGTQPNLLVLGPVDKVDSQISRSVIQDCLLGGSFGSRRPDRYGMADHRGAVAH